MEQPGDVGAVAVIGLTRLCDGEDGPSGGRQRAQQAGLAVAQASDQGGLGHVVLFSVTLLLDCSGVTQLSFKRVGLTAEHAENAEISWIFSAHSAFSAVNKF